MHRDQDDDEPIQRSGDAYDESEQQRLTFEQEKAELKRRMMAPQQRPKKVKKLKKDQGYNPDGKSVPHSCLPLNTCSAQE